MTWIRTTILGVLVALPGIATRGDAQDADGKALYLKNCRSCHGDSGTPSKQALRETPKIAKLDQAFLSTRSDDSLTAAITRGVGKDMKPFKDKLSAPEIEAVVKYVRTLGASTPKKEP